ncbi:AIPR family protein [Primorskyibacter aestuariivivens]|uniref:AIPR family protein n=1 Tax=Primorskyibacter aestuariivivens TaxID=1888912 RepID=UPI00230089E3|nr:AIPR family protein [Primorskyibacter aestuariivivens]MDA7427918.1 AIPR family protein [Primorskyibacter aestuariivivens]
MSDLEEFHHELIADIQGDADVLGLVTVEAFFEKVGELLTEAGELDGANRAYFEGGGASNPMRLDGYGGDPRDGDGVLSLVLCDFDLSEEVRVQNKEQIQRLLQRLYRFVVSSLKADFREQLEETSAGFGVADLIATTWKDVEKVKLIIVTNADFRARADAANVKDLDGRPVTLSVWDLKRLKQYMEQGQARANLIIDFDRDFGGSVPLLAASGSDSALESYLAVIPGKQLAAIYDKWGPRLLEANVRSFLQARGKVNQGIRNTIRDEPHMFFSYNNGLSATADAIEVEQGDHGQLLVRADNLQIVNGGQTTASLHAARKAFVEQLEQVHVQMKLTIVPREQSELVVPRISEYANSQNKVNAADFFANHPFHIRTEELSRKVLARGEDGYRDTKWFYERARGQYADERGRRTIAERKKFDAEFPRSQFLTKTDLAKFENTWACLPHIVSLGAQKNFAEFAKHIGKRWGSEGAAFDELWFRRMIAKTIIFRATEKLVSGAEWYEGGYRANIVTYAIAKLVHDAEEREMVVDLDAVWRYQDVSPDLKAALLVAAAEAQDVITHPPEGVRNFSEWAKKQACWKGLEDRELIYPEEFDRVLISPDLANERAREARADKAVETSVEVELEVHRLGAAFWAEARNWARERGLLSPRENGVLETCAAIPNKMPSDKQCAIAMSALNKLQDEGFRDNTG